MTKAEARARELASTGKSCRAISAQLKREGLRLGKSKVAELKKEVRLVRPAAPPTSPEAPPVEPELPTPGELLAAAAAPGADGLQALYDRAMAIAARAAGENDTSHELQASRFAADLLKAIENRRAPEQDGIYVTREDIDRAAASAEERLETLLDRIMAGAR